MLLGFLKPSEGNIDIFGSNPFDSSTRALVGYLPENPRLPGFLTAEQLLRYFGKLYDLKGPELESEIDRQLEIVKLSANRHERVSGFSKGMVQRLAFAQCLMNRASLLILDEPMSGLDPVGRIEMRNLLRSIHKNQPDTTLLFTSHILADVEELCTSIILLRNGKMMTHDSLHSLFTSKKQTFEILINKAHSQNPERLSVTGIPELHKLLSSFINENVEVLSIESHQKRLEETLFGEHV